MARLICQRAAGRFGQHGKDFPRIFIQSFTLKRSMPPVFILSHFQSSILQNPAFSAFADNADIVTRGWWCPDGSSCYLIKIATSALIRIPAIYLPYLPRCHVSLMRSLVGLLAEESNVGICFHPGHLGMCTSSMFITHQVHPSCWNVLHVLELVRVTKVRKCWTTQQSDVSESWCKQWMFLRI